MKDNVYKLKDSVKCVRFDRGDGKVSFLLTEGKRNWQIEPIVEIAINMLREGATVEQLQDKLSIAGDNLSRQDVVEFIDFMKNNGLLEGTQAQKKLKADGIWLKIPIIPKEWLKRLKILPNLYMPQVFAPIVAIETVWIIYMLCSYRIFDISKMAACMTLKQAVLLYIVSLAITAFHELGHASAIVYGEGEPGAIGAGIYYIIPVAWSEVNNAWALPRRDRLRVDYGGIYFQIMLSVVLYLINYFWLHNDLLLMACIISIQTMITNFSPVLRFDGHWMVMDAFGIISFKEELRSLFAENRSGFDKKKIIFIIYSIISAILLVYFATLMVSVLYSSCEILYADIMSVAGRTGVVINSITPKIIWNYIQKHFTALLIVGSMGVRIVIAVLKVAGLLLSRIKGSKS